MKIPKKPITVADVEAKSGKKDTIRNPDGSNAYSNLQISTLQKKLIKLLPGLTLPETKVTAILIQYADGSKASVAGGDLDKAATVLHAVGVI